MTAYHCACSCAFSRDLLAAARTRSEVRGDTEHGGVPRGVLRERQFGDGLVQLHPVHQQDQPHGLPGDGHMQALQR